MGSFAVDMFFFISGLLITASWQRSKTMDDYLRRRVLRIYPAYVVALVFSLGIAMTFSGHPLDHFMARISGLREAVTLGSSSSTGQWVFPNNPVPNNANGSLWTIDREFQCYLIVAAIGLFKLFRFRVAILLITLLNYGYYALSVHHGIDIERADRRFLTFFLIGACAWLWRERIKLRLDLAVVAVVSLVAGALMPRLFRAVTPLAADYLMLFLGFRWPLSFCAWCNRTDLSYGTYLFAFPVQQAFVALGVSRPHYLFLTTIPFVAVMALLSWSLIEKRFLRFKNFEFNTLSESLKKSIEATRKSAGPLPIQPVLTAPDES